MAVISCPGAVQIQIALGAKMKLGFINGKSPKPAETDDEFEQWTRADCMVTSWLLNSISKDLVESFLYTSTEKELWEQLEARFGESNGPLIYHIRREIASVSQGNLSISAYFGKIKKLWDELVCLAPAPVCSCGAAKAVVESLILEQLMQFLMGLNDSYDPIRNQILLMEPFPSVTKAYSMVLRVEKQREVSSGLSTAMQNMAMQVRGTDPRRFGNLKNSQKRRGQIDKKNFVCEHCGKLGMEKILVLISMESQNETESVNEELAHNAMDENTFSDFEEFDEFSETLRRSTRVTSQPAWMQDFEPKSYDQANKHAEWREAMKTEITALEKNQTWEVVPLPNDKKPIGCRWVYKLKLKEDGQIDRYKARLVAKGYNQLEDINNAFLHGSLDEEIYMTPPEGCHVPAGHVCNSEEMIRNVKHFLDTLFTIKDLGIAKYFRGLEIARSPQGLAITQTKYIRDILKDTGLSQAKTVTTPLPAGIKFSADAGSALPNPEVYRRLVGRLLYLGFTRPDISHASQQLSQFLQYPCKEHQDAATHLLRYLKGTAGKGLFFPTGDLMELKAYCDADWASCKDTRRSLTGYCIFLGKALIS
ncbi:UNVERIFIED_CONTAM: Retrovirus-related Pol polyprotein from transposon RE1 [Sesamum latifolium]|uniref:Retrovirus-related Pol polyprotein from transposon RE1 n=1 Tax=Sesamum latifolium TaxID=2727402 RepID=A0AAW2UKF3_9LAMI